MRVQFRKGMQRNFLQKVLENINCPSISELANRLNFNYSTLKNYFVEQRNLPETLFDDLCYLANIDKSKVKFNLLKENWGQSNGGKNKS
jgi:nitrate reductase beta subunit